MEDDKDYGWKVEVTAAVGIDEATGKTVPLTYEIIEEELEIKKAFNFVPVNGAVARGVEDTDLVISATDTSLFTCTAWDEWDLVPSNEVAFTEASLVDGLPGEIAVVDGKIVYNPESDYNTEDFWEGDTEPFIEAKAVWTKNPEKFVTVRIPVSIKAVEDASRVSDWEWQMDDFTEGAAIPGFGGEDSLGKVIFYLDDVDVVDEAPDCRDAQLSLVNAAGETVMVLNGSYEVTNATGPYTLVFTASADQAVPYDLVKHNAASAEYGVKLTYVTAEGDEANVVKTQEVRTVTVYDTDRAPVVTNFVVNGLENGVAYADSKLSFACDFTDADAEDMEHISTTVKFSVDGDTWNDVAQLPAVLTKGDTYLFYASASYDSDWQVGNADEYAGNSIIVHVKNTAPAADKAGANLFIQREEGVTEGRTRSCTFTITDIDGADDLILALDANGTEGTEITDNNGTLALALVDGTVTAEFTMNDAIGTDSDVTNMQYTFYVGDNGNDGSFANALKFTVTIDYMADPAPVVAVVTG
ncbi:MAG: hypothetical protein J6S21_08200, partial [Victivallales bacterium]|nr:hypothetical protein [Victivallales bacterium]